MDNDLKEVSLRIAKDIKKRLEKDLGKALNKAAVEINNEIVKNKLSPGGYLGVVTGNLRRSVRYTSFVDSLERAGIKLGSNLFYFASYETGDWSFAKFKREAVKTNTIKSHPSTAAAIWKGRKERPFVKDTLIEYFKSGKFKL